MFISSFLLIAPCQDGKDFQSTNLILKYIMYVTQNVLDLFQNESNKNPKVSIFKYIIYFPHQKHFSFPLDSH